ncbi:hypothetical protein LTR17_006947 [Elasticomyces elasticus]|nr:hypothetical protein LTR17_006947 [Elasticomyces elasticus]
MAVLSKPARRDVIRVVNDWGTGFVKVGAQYVREGQRFEEVDIDDIPLQPGHYRQLEQIMVLDGDNFVCGKSQILLTKHFSWILKAVMRFYREQHISGMNQDTDHDKAQVQLVNTVPCNWDDEACIVIRNAACEAKLHDDDTFEVVPEPICAAAYDLTRMIAQGHVKYGDLVCFFDIGKGTADIATVCMSELAEPSPSGARKKLVIVGKTPSHDEGGAQVVNDLAWKYVESPSRRFFRRWGSLKATCAKLGDAAFE